MQGKPAQPTHKIRGHLPPLWIRADVSVAVGGTAVGWSQSGPVLVLHADAVMVAIGHVTARALAPLAFLASQRVALLGVEMHIQVVMLFCVTADLAVTSSSLRSFVIPFRPTAICLQPCASRSTRSRDFRPSTADYVIPMSEPPVHNRGRGREGTFLGRFDPLLTRCPNPPVAVGLSGEASWPSVSGPTG